MREWICQIRPGNPYNGKFLSHKDFYRPKKAMYFIFEEGIEIDAFMPSSQTIVLRNRYFCVVKKAFIPHTVTLTHHITGESRTVEARSHNIQCVCLPEYVFGREVLFSSPNINWKTIR